MDSWEVLREAIEKVTFKAVASKLKVSSALVYKWCQEPSRSNRDSSGALNPLDRIHVIYEMTHDPQIINWMCNVAGGFFVANPVADATDRDEKVLASMNDVIQDFAQLSDTVTQSFNNDGRISEDEAKHIRRRWEELKRMGERFVLACERGLFTGTK